MNWCYILGTCTNFVFDGDMPNVIGKVVHGMLELVSVWRQYMFLGDVMVDIEVVVDEKDGGRKVTNSPISGGRLKRLNLEFVFVLATAVIQFSDSIAGPVDVLLAMFFSRASIIFTLRFKHVLSCQPSFFFALRYL